MLKPAVWIASLLAAGSAIAAGLPPLDADGGGRKRPTDVKPGDVIEWQAFEATEEASGRVIVQARMTAKSADWRVYAANLSFSGPPGFTVERTTPPPTRRFLDPISGEEVDVYEGGEFAVAFTGAPRWTDASFPLSVRYVGCTNVICLFPYTETLAVPFVAYVAPSATVTATATATAAAATNATTAAPEEEDLESQLAKQLAGGNLSYQMLLLLVFVGGLLSNLTPCVYPMIPITLRVLAKQGHSPYTSASFYALGIIITYSTLGLVAALSGGMFGSLLASKTFNIVFAVIMALLGATMLGFGDLSRLQMLGNRMGTGKPSAGNTFLMGAGAGLVAAPCTGPILAALLAYTAKGGAGVAASTLLLFSYSVGFGLPYVALGGAAAKVSKVKVGHHVQVAVKLLFASVMFGLALYYLRIPLYGVLERLSVWWPRVATVGLVAGLALAAVWVLVPRLQVSKASMFLPTVVLGCGIFGTSQWLTTSPAATPAAASLTWHRTEAETYAAARATGKPVLIDFWAEWCEACKKMDHTTFADERVIAALSRGWTVARLDMTEDNEANTAIQAKYGLQSLPTLVLMPADGRLEGKQAITGFVSAAVLINNLTQYSHKAE